MNRLISALLIFAAATLTSSCNAHPLQSTQSRPTLFKPTQEGSTASDLKGHPNEIALGDWNGDGRLDLVTCNSENTVTVLLGDGRGGFRNAPGSPINLAAHLVASGDVNKDGKLDLALTHHDSFGVVVLLGAGDGHFAPAPASPFNAHQGSKAHNHGLALNDLNLDGNLDITTSNQDDNSVSVLLGNGKGGFTPAAASPFAVGRAPYPHSVADMNADGHPDIVTPNVGSNDVTILLGNGKGNFAPAPGSPIRVESRPYYVVAADVNDDRKPDIITSHDDISLLTTLLGDGRGRFTPAPGSPFDIGQRAFKLVAADVSGDARMELIIGTESSDSVLLLTGYEGGAYKPVPGSPFKAGRSPRVAVGDVNGDGKPDIITANHGSGDITVLLRQ